MMFLTGFLSEFRPTRFLGLCLRKLYELTRFEVEPGVDYGDKKPPYLFAKAEVFDSRDIAAMWFRTKGGRLTQRLMEQLGDVDSEFVEWPKRRHSRRAKLFAGFLDRDCGCPMERGEL
jgi:hypothetical protein